MMYIDDTDEGGNDIQAFLRTIDDSTSTIKGHVRISNRTNANDFVIFTISGTNTEATGYHKVNISYVSGATSFDTNENLIVTFARTGTKGDTGAQGATGSGGSTGAQGATGSTGSQGAAGAQGATGSTGPTGPTGATGAQGATAAQGAQGATGSTGAQGASGSNGGTDIVNDSSPQLGGNLDLNGNSILLDDNEKIFIGTSNDGSLFNSGSYLFLKNHNGNVAIQASGTGSVISLQKYDNSDIGLQYVVDGKIQLNYDNESMLETESRGAFVKRGNGSDTTFTVGSTDASGVRICLDGDSNGDAYGNDYAFLQHNTAGNFVISADNPSGNAELIFCSGNSNARAKFDSSGHFYPVDNDTYDLGQTTLRWRNLYVNDLQLCNGSKAETGGNDVDGTWGDWTLQEGENDIFMINRRNGKKFKINMTEVS